MKVLTGAGPTSDCSGERGGKHQTGSDAVGNAEILDDNESDDTFLDVTIDDVENDAAVGDDAEQEDEDNQSTLDSLAEDVNLAHRVPSC